MGRLAVSFLRPEVVRLFARWAETAAYLALTGFGIWFLMSSLTLSPAWRWGMIAFVALVGFWFARSAAVAALARREGEAPGVVQIDERRVAYFGPHQGGLVSINDIFAIEIWAADPSYWRYEAEWVLRWSETEAALIIPVSAKGAEGLADAFTALPGFAAERALAALRAPEGATVTIWRRREHAEAPALAPPGGRP